MKGLLCDSTSKDVDVFKSDYQFYHFINEKIISTKGFFSPDNISKSCDEV